MSIDANKIRKDIGDLRDKKQTLLFSLQNDIEEINRAMLEAFGEIGKKAYEMSSRGEDSLTGLADDFAGIDRHIADQEAKNKKITEISERYDEEILILEKLVPKEAPSPAPSAQRFCPSCGKKYTPGQDLFCLNCGVKLEGI